MEPVVYWPVQGHEPFLPLSQQHSQPFVELTGGIDGDAVDYETPLYGVDIQPSAPSQPRFRWRPHRLY